MIARFLQVPVWDLRKVAVHYQDEAATALMAQFEARLHKRDELIKAKAMSVEIVMPYF